MQAIEFKAKIKDGVIEIPKEYLKNLSKEFRVIILVEQKETIQEPKKEKKKRLKALQVKTRDLVFDREEAHER